MDSQLTLVDIHASGSSQGVEGGIVLLFEGHSMLNNVLHIKGTQTNSPAYIIESNRTASRTEIRRVVPITAQFVTLFPMDPFSTVISENPVRRETSDLVDEQVVVSRILRNELLPDVIEFSGIRSMQRKKWLKHQRFFDPHFQAGDENKTYFVWRPVDRRQLELYSESSSQIIARFWTHIPGVEAAKLALIRPEAEAMFEAVITSLILVEQKYRVKEKNAMLASPHSTSLPVVPG
ncbi:hypothetical protein C8Q75DRAFT_731676 [Abortiporus biennis]|nr:hypothetical protein C8Q75DRAFT_731676 [Abortiporus biennis]